MRRGFAVLLVIIAMGVLNALEGPGVAFDAATVQDVFLGDGSWHLSADLRCPVSEDFEIRLPVAVTFNGRATLVEAGFHLDYRPWEGGLFMGLTLAQIGIVGGRSSLGGSVSGLNEVSFGCTVRLGGGFFVEPSVTVRDPSGTFQDEYSAIKGEFPCYSRFRVRLCAGYQMPAMPRWMLREEIDKEVVDE